MGGSDSEILFFGIAFFGKCCFLSMVVVLGGPDSEICFHGE